VNDTTCGVFSIRALHGALEKLVRRQQLRPFEQPAEFLLRGFVVRAFVRVNVGHGLILHFESFELDDAQEDFSLLPDLALLEPH